MHDSSLSSDGWSEPGPRKAAEESAYDGVVTQRSLQSRVECKWVENLQLRLGLRVMRQLNRLLEL